jgi:hypothetical protein
MDSANILKISGVHVYEIIALQQDRVRPIYKTPVEERRSAVHLQSV